MGGRAVKCSTPVRIGPWTQSSSSVPGSSVSSNQFANGSDQNVGNVLTDRRTIRVSAPPGGHSSFSLSTMFDSDPHDRFSRR